VNGSGNISVRKISMWAMQIMLDMMMDLMNKIAREAAMILEKDSQRTLTVHDIATAASLILRDGKDAHSCTTMLELNISAYANYRYNK
jgi:histone H3/H4